MRTVASISAADGDRGYHGEATTWHGLARAGRRGLQSMRILGLLTAAAVNLERLAGTALAAALAMLVAMADALARSTFLRRGPSAA